MPPVLDLGLYVTDRRIILLAVVVRLLCTEYSQWFCPVGDPAADAIKTVETGKHRVLGPYLRVDSEAPRPGPFRSSRVSTMLYLRSPETVKSLIMEGMSRGAQ